LYRYGAGTTAPGALGSASLTAKRDAKEMKRRREEDMKRLTEDRAMLHQFMTEDYVTVKGQRHGRGLSLAYNVSKSPSHNYKKSQS
jgi:hypothetical protein